MSREEKQNLQISVPQHNNHLSTANKALSETAIHKLAKKTVLYYFLKKYQTTTDGLVMPPNLAKAKLVLLIRLLPIVVSRCVRPFFLCVGRDTGLQAKL